MTSITPSFKPCEILGVPYFHTQTPDGGDLYLTEFGLPFARQLLPENWREPDWFVAHRQKLRGTSTIYRTITRPVDGQSLEIVVRYNRVGEELPVDTLTLEKYINADFNSPFEEIAVLAQLRATRRGPDKRRMPTKKPLAIFEPPDLLQLWQSGRLESKIAQKLARYPQATLDIRRQYILIYGWITGHDAQQVADQRRLEGEARETFLKETTAFVTDELAEMGFRVLDMKPAHVILRFDGAGNLKRRQDGQLLYALVDYELLEKIPAAEIKS
jgi:hypothetical protein